MSCKMIDLVRENADWGCKPNGLSLIVSQGCNLTTRGWDQRINAVLNSVVRRILGRTQRPRHWREQICERQSASKDGKMNGICNLRPEPLQPIDQPEHYSPSQNTWRRLVPRRRCRSIVFMNISDQDQVC